MYRTLCFRFSLAFSGLVLLSPVQKAACDDVDELTAKQILDRMVKVYTECRSYRDTVKLSSGKGTLTSFKYVFVRPNCFKFECKDGKSKVIAIIWQNAKEYAYARDGMESPKYVGSLKEAFEDCPNNSTDLYSEFITKLLIHEQPIPNKEVWEEATRIDDAMIGDDECYRISESKEPPPPYYNPWTFWIDKKSFLIRRSNYVMPFLKTGRIDIIMNYDPYLNEEISDKEFEIVALRKE